MDFETIQFAIPIWKDTRPYQQSPFQFSVHRLSPAAKVDHLSFLDLSGDDPSSRFAEALIAACGKRGPVFVYNAGFETARINELAERFPRLKQPMLAINARVVDLLKVAEQYYYHPSQEGSWSLKKVLPSIAPDLSYDKLVGVQDGGMAMNAYLEAISRGHRRDAKRRNWRAIIGLLQVRHYRVATPLAVLHRSASQIGATNTTCRLNWDCQNFCVRRLSVMHARNAL